MAVHGFRLADVAGLNRSKKALLRWGATVQYGDDAAGEDPTQGGARYEQGNGTEWLVFSDLGITLRDTAIMTVFCGLIEATNVPPNWIDGKTRQELRQAVIDRVSAQLVWPVTIPDDFAGDPHDYVASQQTVSAPWFEARLTIPPGLTPVSDGP